MALNTKYAFRARLIKNYRVRRYLAWLLFMFTSKIMKTEYVVARYLSRDEHRVMVK